MSKKVSEIVGKTAESTNIYQHVDKKESKSSWAQQSEDRRARDSRDELARRIKDSEHKQGREITFESAHKQATRALEHMFKHRR